MQAIHLLFTLGIFVALTDEKPATETRNLQGTWIVAAAEGRGKPVEQLKGAKVIFSGETVTFNVAGHEESGKYKIDATKKPIAIDIIKKTPDGKMEVDRGIYQLDGNELKLCQGGIDKSRSFPEDKETVVHERKRPLAFDSKQGLLMTLKREQN